MNKSCNKFIRYSNLNEISKFSNFDNFFLLSNIKSIRVWSKIDLSKEKSKSIYLHKSLLSIFLIYLVTNKYPKISSTKNTHILNIEVNLSSSDLFYFLEKFLFTNNLKQQNLLRHIKINDKFISFFITDLNIFNELDSFISFFEWINPICIDINCVHGEDYRNFIFISNLIRSSYFI